MADTINIKLVKKARKNWYIFYSNIDKIFKGKVRKKLNIELDSLRQEIRFQLAIEIKNHKLFYSNKNSFPLQLLRRSLFQRPEKCDALLAAPFNSQLKNNFVRDIMLNLKKKNISISEVLTPLGEAIFNLQHLTGNDLSDIYSSNEAFSNLYDSISNNSYESVWLNLSEKNKNIILFAAPIFYKFLNGSFDITENDRFSDFLVECCGIKRVALVYCQIAMSAAVWNGACLPTEKCFIKNRFGQYFFSF